MENRISVVGGNLDKQEIDNYVTYISQKNPNREIKSLKIEVDGDFVNLTYELEPVSFYRIRRITGYLVGNMDRWNDAKRAEERDRVKHSLA